MVGEVILCALAAAGLLTVCWCLLGALIVPAASDAAVYLVSARTGSGELRRRVRAHMWLQDAGLLRARLYLVDDGTSPEATRTARHLAREFGAGYCTKAQLLLWLNGGTTELGTDGTEDPAGHRGGCDLSE